MKLFRKMGGLKILIPLAAVLFSLVTTFTGTIAWFSMSNKVTATGMTIKAYVNDTIVSCSTYKYIVGSDEVDVKTGDAARNFMLNQYDRVFTHLNRYNPLYLELEITGSSLSTTGTLSLEISRDISIPILDNDRLSSCFSSVTKFAAVGNSAYTETGSIFVSGNNIQTWNHLQSVFDNQNITTKRFVYLTQENAIDKYTTLNLSVAYTADDFIDNTLVVYLCINYDESLVESFMEDFSEAEIGNGITLTNDLTTLYVM